MRSQALSLFICTLTTALLLSITSVSDADFAGSALDLTDGPDSSPGTINGGIFEFGVTQPAGTGVFGTFLRIKNGHGYNTSAAKKDIPNHFDIQDGGSSHFTRDLRFGDLAAFTLEGSDYLGFSLDSNEQGGNKSLLSLDKLQIYTSPFASLSPDDPADLGTLRYDLGAGSSVLMDAKQSTGPGSGSSDLDFYIPLDNFVGVGADDYLYLYAAFGLQDGYEADGGFEEFAALPGTNPLTSTTYNYVFSTPTPTAGAAGLVMMLTLALKRRTRPHTTQHAM
ncbi:MAG: hypothetical protein WD294_07950 [Phycisphaeraceae bacterium]